MLRRLYAWTMAKAEGRGAMWALAAVAFAESAFFPIPPDVILVPMVLARRERAFLIAALCTAASVVGGLAGYVIGYFLFEAVGRPLVAFYGYSERYAAFQALYDAWGAWIVAGAGFSPFPYKVITIASGAVGLDPVVFLVASAASRGLRFFIEAALLWRFGAPIRGFIERHLGKIAGGVVLAVIAIVVALRLLR